MFITKFQLKMICMEILYNYWYDNRNLWFNSKPEDDETIEKLFGNLYYQIIDFEKINESRKYAVGIIILYDQISRHIIRTNKSDILYGIPRDNFINDTNKKAIELAESVYKIYKYALFADEYVFVMLPFRHSGDIMKIKFVMSETWEKIENESAESEINKFKQFLKATYEKSIIQSNDEILLKVFTKCEDNFNIPSFQTKLAVLKDKYKLILDDKVFKKIESSGYNRETFKEIENLKKTIDEAYIVSISGGVDSMICSYLLKKYDIPFVCVHINYNNRKESNEEEEFVIDWCKLLGVDLYVRKIEEICRPQCMKYNLRELYEDYTRDIRYGTYLKVNKNPYVILGHNQDDCFENILTNISHKSKYENLFGMEILNKMTFKSDIINFVRPMLSISKKQIYDCANYFNIPFLWDSTPKWSQRGKIRDMVRPTLEKWDSEIISGIFEMSKMLKESLELVDIMVDTWISKINKNKFECKFHEIPEHKIFWKKLFQKLEIYNSNSSMNGYIAFINRFKNGKIKIDINTFANYELNKDYRVKLMKLKDNKVLFFIDKKT